MAKKVMKIQQTKYHYCWVLLLLLASSPFSGVNAGVICPPDDEKISQAASASESTVHNSPLALRLWVDDQSFELNTKEYFDTTIPISAHGVHSIVLESPSVPFHQLWLGLGGEGEHSSSPSSMIPAPQESEIQSTSDCLQNHQVRYHRQLTRRLGRNEFLFRRTLSDHCFPRSVFTTGGGLDSRITSGSQAICSLSPHRRSLKQQYTPGHYPRNENQHRIQR